MPEHDTVPGYRGRFAPSPTGALHAGSLVAALASWLDARAHGGQWLVRMEDVDTPRCIPGMDQHILRQLARCGLVSDGPVLWQSQRGVLYRQALAHLVATGRAYTCQCSRKDIAAALAAKGWAKTRGADQVYPGTCRTTAQSDPALPPGKTRLPPKGGPGEPLLAEDQGSAWRFLVDAGPVYWTDRRLGAQHQMVATAVGDFVVRRKDGLFAYQLAVVVDDALQGITHVVRGQDLADNTARQILLQTALGYPTPRYLHTPLVLAADGHKLSKQNGAAEVATHSEAAVLDSLRQAARTLGLEQPASGDNRDQALLHWTHQWRSLYTTP